MSKGQVWFVIGVIFVVLGYAVFSTPEEQRVLVRDIWPQYPLLPLDVCYLNGQPQIINIQIGNYGVLGLSYYNLDGDLVTVTYESDLSITLRYIFDTRFNCVEDQNVRSSTVYNGYGSLYSEQGVSTLPQ
jgi:hypothetical protein